jgi:Uma2 family endonuclease
MALRAKWEFMDRSVTHKILYGPQLRFGPNILNTSKSVRRYVFVIVYLRQKTNSDKIRKKTLYWSGPVHILKYWLVNVRKYWAMSSGYILQYHQVIYYNVIRLYTTMSSGDILQYHQVIKTWFGSAYAFHKLLRGLLSVSWPKPGYIV